MKQRIMISAILMAISNHEEEIGVPVDETGAWHRLCTEGLHRRSDPMTIDRDVQPPLEEAIP